MAPFSIISKQRLKWVEEGTSCWLRLFQSEAANTASPPSPWTTETGCNCRRRCPSRWHFSVTHNLTRWLKATLGSSLSPKVTVCSSATSKSASRRRKGAEGPHNTICITHHNERKTPEDESFSPVTLTEALCTTVSNGDKTKRNMMDPF